MGCSGSAPAGSADPAMKGKKPLVLVTGITGYIGAVTVKALLESKRCRVRATMRGATDEAKLATLREGFGAAFSQIEIVEGELLDEEQMKAACAGCDYVLHVASPVAFGKSEEEMVPPARDGTLNVLKGCVAAKVKRCVYVGTIFNVVSNTSQEAGHTYDETQWAESEETYAKSKQVAEKAAWDFVNGLPEEDKLELVSILPGLVWGPPALKSHGVSISFLTGFITGQMNPFPRMFSSFVDVRDVVAMITSAMTTPEANGKRILSVGCMRHMRDAVTILEDKFGTEWPVSKDEAEGDDGPEYIVDTTVSKTVLGIEYMPLEKTIVDTVEAMIASGALVKPEPAAE